MKLPTNKNSILKHEEKGGKEIRKGNKAIMITTYYLYVYKCHNKCCILYSQYFL